jgi:sec-independent protein translocase protein TatA
MGLGLDNPIHWVFVLVVLLLLFGARRLPEIGRSLGSGIREFKHSVTGESEQATGGADRAGSIGQGQAPPGTSLPSHGASGSQVAAQPAMPPATGEPAVAEAAGAEPAAAVAGAGAPPHSDTRAA